MSTYDCFFSLPGGTAGAAINIIKENLMKMKRITAFILTVALIFSFATLCFAEESRIEKPTANCYTYTMLESVAKESFSYQPSFKFVELEFGDNVVSMTAKPNITSDGHPNKYVNVKFNEVTHVLSFQYGDIPSGIIIPADTVFDANGKGNDSMVVEVSEVKELTIQRKVPIFKDAVDDNYYYRTGETIELSCDEGKLFSVYVDEELFASNVNSCSIPVESGLHTFSVDVHGSMFNSEYYGSEKFDYDYFSCVSSKLQQGAETIASAFTSALAMPAASLAIPVIGPILSAMSVIIGPLLGIGAIFSGLGQIIASPFTGLIMYNSAR